MHKCIGQVASKSFPKLTHRGKDVYHRPFSSKKGTKIAVLFGQCGLTQFCYIERNPDVAGHLPTTGGLICCAYQLVR